MSPDEDSARWEGFPFRAGDVVVSTRSKHGTTWMQTILLLLIHQRPDFPAPLAELAPWLDHLVESRDDVVARLEAQEHRRVIKTHTPLDGVPLDPVVTYIVVGRHPLDAAVSLYHQGDNLDRQRMQELTGAPPPQRTGPRPTVKQWLEQWIDTETDPAEDLDSLPGVLWHLTDAWTRRREPNVVLVHYADLLGNLSSEMARLRAALNIDVPDDRWVTLVEAATLSSMRARAEVLAPNAAGVLKDNAAFFRRGTSGAAAEILHPDTMQRYHDRVRAMAPPDLLAWLHR